MPEVTIPAKLVIVEYKCDACEAGTMVRANDCALMSFPAKYLHQCTACGARKTFATSYPAQRIQKEDES